MNIGRSIKLIRTAKKITQKQLAVKVGCSPNYLSIVERGDKRPSLDFIENIANALEVPLIEIFALAADEASVQDTDKQEIIKELRKLMLLLNQIEA